VEGAAEGAARQGGDVLLEYEGGDEQAFIRVARQFGIFEDWKVSDRRTYIPDYPDLGNQQSESLSRLILSNS
jgi:hypothetical protein